MECPVGPRIDPRYAQFVADLAVIQAFTGVIGEVPEDSSPADFANAAAGAALIRGEEALQSWDNLTLNLKESPTGVKRRRYAEGPVSFAADLPGPVIVRICSTEYPIGRNRHLEVVGRVSPEVSTMLLEGDSEITELVLNPEPGTFLKMRVVDR